MPQGSAAANIMVVDDSPANIALLKAMLGRRGHRVHTFTSGKEALAAAAEMPPDLILLDITMPEMSGYDVCERLKMSAQLMDIPVFFMSALDEPMDKVKAFSIGGVDYLTKPFQFDELHARVATHLELKAAKESLKRQNEDLEKEVRRRTKEILDTQDVTIHGLAVLAEYRDNETGGHIMRTQRYVRALADRMATFPRLAGYLTEDNLDLLFKSMPLHDIGKVAVPDRILLKPGKLTESEAEEMKLHTIYGRDAILRAEGRLNTPEGTSFLRIAREITLTHHERWDGSGYPQGLKGEAIPFSGRLMGILDVYDALISKRVYKPPLPHETAVDIITKGDGRVMPTHFDPDILQAFSEAHENLRDAAVENADHQEERDMLMRRA